MSKLNFLVKAGFNYSDYEKIDMDDYRNVMDYRHDIVDYADPEDRYGYQSIFTKLQPYIVGGSLIVVSLALYFLLRKSNIKLEKVEEDLMRLTKEVEEFKKENNVDEVLDSLRKIKVFQDDLESLLEGKINVFSGSLDDLIKRAVKKIEEGAKPFLRDPLSETEHGKDFYV